MSICEICGLKRLPPAASDPNPGCFLCVLGAFVRKSAVGRKELTHVRFCARLCEIMTSITATQARAKLYNLIDETNVSHHPIQITGKRGNAVLVSEEDWMAISETLQLSAIPGMVDSIKRGMKEKIENCSEELDW